MNSTLSTFSFINPALVSRLRIYFEALDLKYALICFCKFSILWFQIQVVIHFGYFLCVIHQTQIKVIYLFIIFGCLSAVVPFAGKVFFFLSFSIEIILHLCQNQLDIFVWAYLWILCSIPLICCQCHIFYHSGYKRRFKIKLISFTSSFFKIVQLFQFFCISYILQHDLIYIHKKSCSD